MSPTVFILVVEDEVLIHELLQEPLVAGGYGVEQAFSGEEAIAALEADPTRFNALITDINLERGKLTGWDVARRARELNASVPVIYMTGAAGHEWPALGVPNSTLLLKPFAPAQVVTAVSQLLNAATSPPP